MKYLDSRRLRQAAPALVVIAALASLPSPGFAEEGECFTFQLPLLFDSSNNCAATYENPRAIQTKIFYWNGKTELMFNRGNELSLLDISNPMNPQSNGSTQWYVPPDGDRDQNLFNYAVCDDCRYGMAGFSGMGTVLFDLGTAANPRFADRHYYNDAGNIGAVVFEYGGQEYILINRFPGCVGTSGLYRFNGVDEADLQVVGCVNAGTGSLDVSGGFYVPGSPAYLYVVDGGDNGHIYRIDPGSPIALTYLGSPFDAPLAWDQGLAIDLATNYAATARNGILKLWDISSPDSPAQIKQWQPNPGARYASVAIKYPYLWVAERGVRETLMYSILNPEAPERIAQDFWEYEGAGAQPWNTYPCMDNRHAVFTDDVGWLFAARFSVLERFEVLDTCLDAAPRAMVSVTPAEVFPGDQVTVTNTTTSTYETAAVWVEDLTGALVVGSGVMSGAEPLSRSFDILIDAAPGTGYTAWVAVATTTYPCDDPLNNPTACGNQVVSQPIPITRDPEAVIIVTPPAAITGDTIELDGSATEGHPQSLLWEVYLDGFAYEPPPPFNPSDAVNDLELVESGEWRFDLTASYAHNFGGGPWSHTDSELMTVSSVAADFDVDTIDPVNTEDITLCFTGMVAPDIASVDYGWEVADNADMSGLRWASSTCTTVAGCTDCGVVIPADTLPDADHTYWVELTVENTDNNHGGFGDVSTAKQSMYVRDGSVSLDFTAAPSSPEIGQTVVFSIVGVTGITKATWNFGGTPCAGSGYQQSTVCTPNIYSDCMDQPYNYSSSGSKTVTLTVQVGAVSYGPVTRTVNVQSSGSCGGSSCTYSISPTSASYTASGGSGSVSVTASPSSCTWTASSSSTWISIISGSSGTGNGTVTYSVSPSTECGTRTGYMTIAGRTFTVTQQGASCSVDFSYTPTNPQIGQTVTFTVTGGATPVSWNFGGVDCDDNSPTMSCTAWPSLCMTVEWVYASAGAKTVTFTAVEGSAAKTVTVGSSGTCPEDCESDGPPIASFTMAPNPARVGDTVTFSDTSGMKVLAADFNWTPVSPKIGQSVTFHITGVGSVTSAVWDFGAGGCGDYDQSTTCTPTPPFLDCMYQPFEYATAGTFNVSLRASGGAAVSKQIVVQNEGACGGGGSCSYTISPTSESFPALGGSGSVSVYSQAGCTWTATTNSTWIHITSGASGSGSGVVNYSVDTNTGAQRSGSMTIAGRSFQVTQAGAGGGGDNTAPTEWHWTVKLGSVTIVTSDEQGFSYVFDAPGEYQVTLLAANCAGSDSSVQTLVVEEVPVPEDFVVPAAAHTEGQNQTMWVSDLSIFNPGSESVVANIEFLKEATNNTTGVNPGRIISIPSKGTDVREDVLGWMGITDDQKGSLSIKFEGGDGSTPVIMSRTYNDTPNGTYGQFVPAVPVLPSEADSVYLTGLVHNASYRTNVGVANLGETGVTDIELRILGPDGTQLGAYVVAVPGLSTVQVVNVAEKAGVTEPLDFFSVEVYTAQQNVTVYASVIDNSTGDPLLYAPYTLDDSEVFVPGVAHLPGANDSLWRSDITFFNPTTERIEAILYYIPEIDLGFLSYLNIGLEAGEVLYLPDVLGDPLLVGGQTNTKGYFIIRSEAGVAPYIAARTFNQTEAGTFGQNLMVYGDSDEIAEHRTASIPGVINNAEFRTNLGLLNLSPDTPASVELKVYDKFGTLMGSHPGYPLDAEQFVQFDLFGAVGLGEVDLYASVEFNVVAGGPVAAYASVVDNQTGDPILIPAEPALQ